MRDDEWTRIASMLEHWWPGEFPAAAAAAYRMLLDRHPAGTVARALGGRAERGERFRPSVAELVGELCGPAVTHPSPDEAWGLIVRAVHKVGCSIYDERFEACHQGAIDWLAGQDRVVAAFAARRGLCGPGSLGVEPVGDPEYGGAVLTRIRKDYAVVLTAAAEREALGKPAVSDRDLLVRATGQRAAFADVLREYGSEQRALDGGR